MNKDFNSSAADLWFKRAAFLVAVVALWPILFPLGDMWDGDRILMHQMLGSTAAYKPLLPHGWYLVYWLRLLFHDISMMTGVPHKAITNVLSVVSVIGIAFETFRYLRAQFQLSPKSAYFGSIGVLAYPVWHVLLSSVHVFYVLFLWLFMAAVNMRRTNRWIALLLFAISLQYFSLFPLAIGFACVEFIMKADRKNFIREGAKVFVFALCLVGVYALLNSLISLHGPRGNYNTLTLREIDSFIDFFLLSIGSAVLWFLGKRFFPEKCDWLSGGRVLLAFWTLVFFASFTYWAVGRPLRFFAFGSFTARHTFLNCIPFALLLGASIEFFFKRFSFKKVSYGAAFVVLALVVLLNQGYSHKVAAMLFKDMLVHSLKQQPAPPSGYVGIFADGYEAPRHVHQYSINLCLYRAYGESKWMANGFWRRHLVPTRKAMEKLYPTDKVLRSNSLAMDVTGDAYTGYTFTLHDYHQEGRVWYWYYYFMEDYDSFRPELVLRPDEGGTGDAQGASKQS